MNELNISPEGIEIANAYLTTSSISETAKTLDLPESKISNMLETAEIKRYIDAIYLDIGYRNRFRMGQVLDEIIENKLEEARESENYTNKDLLDVISLVHKMRIEELRLQQKNSEIKNQTNVQINEGPFGSGQYGKLMEKLLGEPDGG